jgi:hypothetical protein
MKYRPLLECHIRIAERQHRSSYLLTELVTFAKNRHDVTRTRHLKREPDGRAPITAIDHFGG